MIKIFLECSPRERRMDMRNDISRELIQLSIHIQNSLSHPLLVACLLRRKNWESVKEEGKEEKKSQDMFRRKKVTRGISWIECYFGFFFLAISILFFGVSVAGNSQRHCSQEPLKYHFLSEQDDFGFYLLLLSFLVHRPSRDADTRTRKSNITKGWKGM